MDCKLCAPKAWSISKAEAKRLLAEEKWEQDPTSKSFAYTAYVSDRMVSVK
jgi:hypothetical protein